MQLEDTYDVIVIGAGHAGVEAALAASRMAAKTALFTINTDKIAEMSCNPAIGGLAKGQLVREIDALGGEMAKAADKTCIQFKLLNSKKGPAVRALRAQADKKEYRLYMKRTCENQKNLSLIQAMVESITTDDKGITGIITSNNKIFRAKAVIVTTGTFLNGLIHIGLESSPGGRRDDPPSIKLSESLHALGLSLGRLKTGTNPRVDKKSLDFSKFIPQPGDKDPIPFSFSTDKLVLDQVLCHLVNTNEKTNKVIEDNLDRSPLYSKTKRKIVGIGPRYCPSIEDKVVKFPEKKSHQVFIEPEERYSDELYLNGLSTSLPLDAQYAYLKTITGFENVVILKAGYGIEYDFVPPTQINSSLEVKIIPRLFLAGQINGTSGYEEAAAQGLVAGINAVLVIQESPPFILNRSESYIGVMIDDLVTKGIEEPYRLFSSRAEFRLVLRNDNADIRLMDYGRKFGLIDDKTYDRFMFKKHFYENEYRLLEKTYLRPGPETEHIFKQLNSPPPEEAVTLLHILKRPEINYEDLKNFIDIPDNVPKDCVEYLQTQIKYEGYIKKDLEKIEQFKKLEKKVIPEGIDYIKYKGLSAEARQKLSKLKPKTLGQATRIQGVTPADINVLLVLIKKDNKETGL